MRRWIEFNMVTAVQRPQTFHQATIANLDPQGEESSNGLCFAMFREREDWGNFASVRSCVENSTSQAIRSVATARHEALPTGHDFQGFQSNGLPKNAE